jgi:hypothetical protein
VPRKYKVDKRVGEKTKYTEYGRNWKEQLDGLSSDRILKNQPKGKKSVGNP